MIMTGPIGISAITRRRVLTGLLAGAGTVAASQVRAQRGEHHDRPSSRSIDIAARPINHFDRSQPNTARFGDLEFRGGLVLSSSVSDFGGWSGLVMEADGSSLLAISDAGAWLSADVSYQSARPTALVRAHLGWLSALNGERLENKRERDAESATLLDGSLQRGTLLIGFERLHRIGRFQIRDRIPQVPSGYMKLPAEGRRMQRNQGMEAIAVIRSGSLRGSVVAFAERLTRGSGYHTGWIWIRGEPRRFQLRDIDGFDITDAAALPDGGLLVLERHFRWTSGIKMRIRRLEAKEIAPGARVAGRILIEADSRHEIDNMEGIAVHRGPSGESVVSIISDDNFNRFLQRTVLLQFALAGE